MNFDDKIEVVKNIGEARAKSLNKMGIETVEDLIEYFPRDYKDRTEVILISEVNEGESVNIRAKIEGKVEYTRVRNLTIVKARLKDESGIIEGVWFNQPYLKNTLISGKEYIFTGKISKKYGRIQMENPAFEVYSENSLNVGRIVPHYTLPKNMSQKTFRQIISYAIGDVSITEFLNKDIIEKYNLCSRDFAINNIHFPKDNESFFRARNRLVFEELLLLQLRLLQLKGNITNKKTGVKITDFDYDEISKKLGFTLTKAQKRVVGEICGDFKSGYVMNRLIQGDVGSGKTAVAMIASYIAINNGYQAVLMAPTDVLANQHYKSFSEIFDNCTLLTSAMKKKEKDKAYSDIESGRAKMIIGTHALIQDKVKYNNIGLVITDEQHRFGVNQRQMLSSKGDNPHTLVMTATPIPRTLALILYGDLDISIIDELPPNRQKIDTFAVGHTYYERLYNFIKKECGKGRQCYIICPMIEENDKMELRSVLSYTEELKNQKLLGLKVECIHGKMKNDEKQDIMTRFAKGEIDVLVSTTVIEVGINVPNATLMIIENAERFGLSALHQLRGRVGRGADKSYCVLVSDAKNKTAKERLGIMCKTNDGFEISEKDLSLRGPGDFFGTRQHGLPEMKIANLYKDINILKLVQECAIWLYNLDKNFEKEENYLLKMRIMDLFVKKIKKICL
ncbi:MAG: ATP-dependent DNA helicase RecG [Lachnospirales bacterium]